MKDKQKENMKRNRIAEYEQKIFSFEMDIAAFKASDDGEDPKGAKEYIEFREKCIDTLKKSIEAVKVM